MERRTKADGATQAGTLPGGASAPISDEDASGVLEPAAASAPAQGAVLVERIGRGRAGGSGELLALLQRGRSQGRRVKPLDGDLKSRTLAAYYPPRTPDGALIADGASMPRSEDPADFKDWINGELDAMAEDNISRVLDISGGDRVMQEFLHDLDLAAFCRQFGSSLLAACMLGPDMEDLNHVRAAVDAGMLAPEHMILVLNEGVIRSGQSPAGAFDAIKGHPDFQALVRAGAKPVYSARLPCMDLLREARLDFYDVAAGRPGPDGRRPRATMQHMTYKWLADREAQHVMVESVGRLP